MSNQNIAIVTASCSHELYQKTSRLFPQELPRYVVDGSKGLFGLEYLIFLHRRLKRKGIKWLILIDEDVIVSRPESILQLVDHMEKYEYGFCGMREGGVHPGRLHNPHIVNLFFSIINFEWTTSHWNTKEMLSHQHTTDHEFSDNLDDLPFAYNQTSLFEAYYCFYFWLRRKGLKGLFLKSSSIADDEYTKCIT